MRLLDLFCGAGGAAMGYSRAGFEVVGVDHEPQPNYPFEFVLADAMEYPLEGFDVIHASPPCQAYSHVTPRRARSHHPDLLAVTRARLLGRTYVIENVVGARQKLIGPILLCGTMFGLRSWRHRLFEIHPPMVVLTPSCDHSIEPLLVTTAGANSRALGRRKSVCHAPLAYGLDWMGFQGLKEAIPPAYTEYIGRALMAALKRKGEE
jgi:DNA (cytosine-5)-methyltransferase 1